MAASALFHVILFQLEETKRRQKIEMWDSMQEGKSYKGSARRPQVSADRPSRRGQGDEGLAQECFSARVCLNRTTTARGLRPHQFSRSGSLTESLCGEEVSTRCSRVPEYTFLFKYQILLHFVVCKLRLIPKLRIVPIT